MISAAFRADFVARVDATRHDDLVAVCREICLDLISKRWSQGWRPSDPLDLELVTSWMREGNRGIDTPLLEHAGSLDG